MENVSSRKLLTLISAHLRMATTSSSRKCKFQRITKPSPASNSTKICHVLTVQDASLCIQLLWQPKLTQQHQLILTHLSQLKLKNDTTKQSWDQLQASSEISSKKSKSLRLANRKTTWWMTCKKRLNSLSVLKSSTRSLWKAADRPKLRRKSNNNRKSLGKLEVEACVIREILLITTYFD